MSRTVLALAAGLATVLAGSAAVAGDAKTIRVEPRSFYGATITLEAGVRVFRPLPRHSHIIINPGNKTPLNVSVQDVTERHYNQHEHNYNGPAGTGGGSGHGGYGAYNDGFFQNGVKGRRGFGPRPDRRIRSRRRSGDRG